MQDIILKKQKLVHDIYINTIEQGNCIGTINSKKLNELLDKREIMINNVIRLQDKIDSLEVSEQERTLLNDINEEIELIQSLEKTNKDALKKLQLRIKNDINDNNKDIKRINLSSKATLGYFQGLQTGGYFIDQKQ